MKLLEYRLRPKRDYLMVAPWQELYKLTEYWKEELAFYEEELQFFDNLVTLYEGPDRKAPELRQLLNDTRLQLRTLMNQADTHLAHLGKVVRDADNSDDELFREEHNVLEDNIYALTGAFRQLKQKLFKTVEHKIPLPTTNTG
jgi:Zn-dependent M32 family carboxypeptidase